MTRMASVKAATVAMRSSGQMIVAVEIVRKAFARKALFFPQKKTHK